MGMSEWAKREVEIACKQERVGKPSDEWAYGCACYKSALKAFESLLEDDHSGLSMSVTKQVLNRLIDGKPLSPIEDTPDAWNEVGWTDKEHKYTCYQSKRMSDLFKYVYDDGHIEYSDINRFICKDEPSGTYWHNSFVANILGELFPITFPYTPYNKPIIAHRTTVLVDPKLGDYDTMAIWSAETPDGKRKEVGRFFRESNGKWLEIDKSEYMERFEMEGRRLGKD